MIRIENLTFSYGRKPPLFDRLSLDLPSGSIYGLLGKNGAGKSTLLKLITGLIFPKQGNLNVAGYKPSDRYPQLLCELFMVTEEFDLPSMKLSKYVSLYSPFYPRFDHALFKEYMKEFDLDADQKLPSLSYGLKKKFLLSFGLATDCKLLILDEPTNGLDIPSKSQFRRIVANAIHEERIILISTHQVRDMENLIDPILIMDEGKIIFFEDYERITRKLIVSRMPELPEDGSIVYAESTLGGYTVIQENRGKGESKINLEILFNSVINNKEKVFEIFKNGNK